MLFPLAPGAQYYLRVEHVDGYGVDNTGVGVAVGSLGSNARFLATTLPRTPVLFDAKLLK
jgi:hypothetical protein